MKECKTRGCENTNLVYSGTDAFMLGIVTETFCYSCANAYAQVKAHMDELVHNG